MNLTKMKIKTEMRWWRQRAKNLYHLARSIYFTYKYGYPAKKMTVVGVTGTDGKTTTTTLIYEMLKAANKKVGMITTVGAKYISRSGIEIDMETGLHTTNPDASQLQPILKRMVEEGVTHLVLEVTAHGIDQYRIWGTNISIGVLTNITREHLDDFINMERYRKTKLKMFLQKDMKYAVLNKDDSNYEFFKSKIQINSKLKILSYGKAGLREVSPLLAGEYNLYNLGAAAAVAKILGVEKVVGEVAENFRGVAGRRQEVKEGQKYRVIVDFAHTPNALEQLLTSLAAEKGIGKQLIVVFGCTGERDKGKRPMMGRVAANLADRVIVTSDDTRNESQDEIYTQIAAGIPEGLMRKVKKENDREKAIKMAVEMAKPGDILVLAGKGHEKTILIGNVERPWSDVEVVRRFLQ